MELELIRDVIRENVIKKMPMIHEQVSRGFTIWGLLGLLAGIFLIIIVLLPAPIGNHGRSPRVVCTSHLKQISLSMILWSLDHGTNFPMEVSITNGGSKELTHRGSVAPTFWAISNQLHNPAVAMCPDDKKRMPPAKSFNALTDRKISYFLHLGAPVEGPNAVLLGDRNVAANRVGLPSGIAEIHDAQTVSWTSAIHKGNGNVALADGSVHQLTSKGFQDFLKAMPISTNTLVIP